MKTLFTFSYSSSLLDIMLPYLVPSSELITPSIDSASANSFNFQGAISYPASNT